MPYITDDYKPSLLMRNGHVHTIWPAITRRVPHIPWVRERITLPDTDFIDMDWYRNGHNRLVVLGHGMEGSTESSYILAAARLFADHQFDVMAWNQRSCSGEMNRLPRFYHHGVSDDLHEVFKHTGAYDEVHYVGYSLGGNIMLKLLGEGQFTVPQNFVCGVAISTPIDLPSCVGRVLSLDNRIYHDRFLRSLRRKIQQKATIMPDKLSAKNLRKVRNLIDFDQYYTAPLHGFSSPEDYYTRSSSRQYLSSIKHPCALLQARDDPMMGNGCYPVEEAKSNDALYYRETQYGGHLGFTVPGNRWRWMENIALDFIITHCNS